MSWTSDELDSLRRAYAAGVLSVTYRDRTVTYESGDALLRRIRVLENELETSSSSSFDSRGRYAKTSKGT